MTVLGNLIGFSAGKIIRINCWKQNFSLKYYHNTLRRNTALMAVVFAYINITKIFLICQNLYIVFIV